MRRLVGWSFLSLFAACHAHGGDPRPPAFTGRGEVSPETIARHWADGSWRPSELVDPARGVVRYWTETAEVEPPRPDVEAHLCGAELTAALAELDRGIGAAAAAAADEDMITCTADRCDLAVPGKSEPTHRAIFAVAPGQPTALVAYLEMAQFTPDAEDAEARVLAWTRDQLAHRCR